VPTRRRYSLESRMASQLALRRRATVSLTKRMMKDETPGFDVWAGGVLLTHTPGELDWLRTCTVRT